MPRRYTKRERAQAVAEASMTSPEAAAESLGIPRTTILYWMDKPEFVALRQKTADQVADSMWATIQLGVKRIAELIPSTDDIGKVGVAVGILYDKRALMTGGPTARTENVSITDGLDDHEKSALRDAIVGELARRADAGAPVPAVGTPETEGADPARG